MKCKYMSLLSLFIDKELDEERASIIKEHLKSCGVCKEEFQVLSEIKFAFTPELNYTVSSDFTDRVLASLPERKISILERFSMWVDDIFPLAKRLVPIPLVLATLLILFISVQPETVTPVSIREALLENNFSQEEMLILGDSKLSSEIALELILK